MAQRASEATRADREFVELRPLLFSIAYRMLGSVSEAEDVVQDAFFAGAVPSRAERRSIRPRATWRRR